MNNKSLDNQFDEHSLVEAIRTFLSALSSLTEIQNKSIYRANVLFNSSAVAGTHFGGILRNTPDLRQLFFLNIKSAIPWDNEANQDFNSEYNYNGINYVGSSLAEFAERKISNDNLRGFLLNFPNSAFGTLIRIDIVKNNGASASVDMSYDKETTIHWLVTNGYIEHGSEYDISSKITPRDTQTVLRDHTKFEPTAMTNQGRRVYKRISVDEFWVVDNLATTFARGMLINYFTISFYIFARYYWICILGRVRYTMAFYNYFVVNLQTM